MALFRRKKAEKPVTKEVEQYIKAEKRERAGLAWLLALVSLAVVSLLILGLFFGGRWAYNRFNEDDSNDTAQTETQNEGSTKDQAQTSTPPADGNKEDTSDTSTDADDQQASADDEDEAADEEAAVSSDQKEDLPQTGPSQPYVFASLVAVVSTLLYRLRIKQRA